mmetsp:Transcript_74166/g.206167  ORF Transcript_74166/g.206167 Transcript_74166/m.206167 type:complete len:233 (-) Transcript_74166:565-1263(-)
MEGDGPLGAAARKAHVRHLEHPKPIRVPALGGDGLHVEEMGAHREGLDVLAPLRIDRAGEFHVGGCETVGKLDLLRRRPLGPAAQRQHGKAPKVAGPPKNAVALRAQAGENWSGPAQCPGCHEVRSSHGHAIVRRAHYVPDVLSCPERSLIRQHPAEIHRTEQSVQVDLRDPIVVVQPLPLPKPQPHAPGLFPDVVVRLPFSMHGEPHEAPVVGRPRVRRADDEETQPLAAA